VIYLAFDRLAKRFPRDDEETELVDHPA
jgi:hypothetical protein